MEEFLFNPYILLMILVWVLPWKGVALWKAARLHHKNWFIAMLILNTLAILEIVYIFFIAKKETLEIEERPEMDLEVK